MTLQNFKWLLDFLQNSGNRELRLIGGEPTLHPKFITFLQEQLFNDNIKHIHIFSNGTFSEEIQKSIINQSKIKNVSLLLNINDLSHNDFQDFRLRNNIDLMKKNNINITSGINIYKKEQDFTYFFNIIDYFKLSKLRWTITTPQKVENSDMEKYFTDKIPSQIKFINLQIKRNLSPSPDCNRIPTCMIPQNFMQDLQILGNNNSENRACSPVLDVQPDMNVIRCFMFSEYQVDIRKFHNIDEIISFFIENIDKKLEGNVYKDECNNCLFTKINKMSCGCKQFYKDKLTFDEGGHDFYVR